MSLRQLPGRLSEVASRSSYASPNLASSTRNVVIVGPFSPRAGSTSRERWDSLIGYGTRTTCPNVPSAIETATQPLFCWPT